MIIKTIQGDLLNTTETHIAQQSNCCTVHAKGIALAINKKYPWADVYSHRTQIGKRNCAENRDVPGTIKIVSSPDKSKHVICMFGQYTPSKPGRYSNVYPNDHPDTYQDRLKYFQECINEIEKQGINAIAMPYLIGCGLAGGIWKDYEKMLNDSSLEITLYKL
jgi:O-acetyl-ADP-ribose deacetylase (regulator of RNase III)